MKIDLRHFKDFLGLRGHPGNRSSTKVDKNFVQYMNVNLKHTKHIIGCQLIIIIMYETRV